VNPLVFPSLLIPVAIGSVFVSLWLPWRKPLSSALLFRTSLGTGFGFGISSCLFVLGLVGWGPSRGGFILAEITLLVVLMAALVCSLRRRSARIPPEPRPGSGKATTLQRMLRLFFYLTLASAGGIFLLVSLQNPHGGWDAWSIWNLRARFIYRGGDQWREAFSPLLSCTHPDYPLLLPAAVARGWSYIGQETVLIPAMLSLGFALATVGIMVSSLFVLRTRTQGYLAGLVLLSTPFFLRVAAYQLADVPLGFFILTTIVMLCLYDRRPEGLPGPLLLAGMAAGFAAWTKNEGLLFIASYLGARGTLTLLERGRKPVLKPMLFFALGLLPMAILIVYHKTRLAPSGGFLFLEEFRSAPARLRELSAYPQILKAFAEKMLTFGEWRVNPLPVLALYLACLGIEIDRRDRRPMAVSILALGLMVAGCFFVYLLSPYDRQWYLTNSLNRLFLQLWPSLIFLFFLTARPIEQAVIAAGQGRLGS